MAQDGAVGDAGKILRKKNIGMLLEIVRTLWICIDSRRNKNSYTDSARQSNDDDVMLSLRRQCEE